MSIEWIEINPASPTATLAGRTDGPAEGRGDAAGAMITFLSNSLTQMGINRRIGQALANSRTLARQMLNNDTTRGVLAVAEIEVSRYGDMEGQRLNYCNLMGPTFQSPQSATRWHEHQPRISAMHSRNGRIIFRYFFGRLRY